MPKPMIRIHDVETGEIIDREMTADELKAHEASALALKALQDAQAAKVAAKASLLDRLGITEEEAISLIG